MVAGLVVARIAGPEVVGVIAFGTAYISIWGFITGLFGTGQIKLISEGKPLSDSLATYSWLQGGSLLLYTLCVLGLFAFQKVFFKGYFESREHEVVIIILLGANVIDQLLFFGNTTFTATLEQAKANLPLVLKAILYHGARVAVVFLGMKAIGLAAVNLASGLLVLPLAWRLIRRLDFGRLSRELVREHIKYAAPILLIVIINAIMEYADKLILAHYTDTKELGYYSVAFSLGGMFLLVANSAGTVFFPLFSNLISRKDWAAVNRKIDVFQKFIALFLFPAVCLLVIIGSPFLITLIGEQYRPSVIPFQVLLLATYFSIFGMPYGNIITGMGRFYINAQINFICLGVFLACIYFLVNPAWLGLGAAGIAINLLILNFVRNLLCIFYSFRIGEISIKASLFLPYLAVGGISLLFFRFGPLFSEWHALWWLAVSPLYLAVVYLALYLFGFLTQDEIRRFMDVLNLKKSYAYMKNELGGKA